MDEEYEEYGRWDHRAMRDPWVMRDPEGCGWLMYFTARIKGTPDLREGGAIGLARSFDLMTWTCLPPVFTGLFGQLEVPQIFKLNGKWYALFCTTPEHWSDAYRTKAYASHWYSPGDAPRPGTHYLISDHHLGPWEVAPGPFLTHQCEPELYSGKVIEASEGFVLMGFHQRTRDGQFIGHITDPIRIRTTSSGLLEIVF